MFAYPCPSCGQRLLAPPDRAGQRTICPKCLKPIVIPRNEPEPSPPEPVPVGVAAEPPASAVAETVFPVGGPSVDALPAPLPLPPPPPSRRAALPPEPPPSAAPTPPPAEDTPYPGPPRPPARLTAALPAEPTRASLREAWEARANGRAAGATGDGGRVLFTPTGVESADLAAELSCALRMRMPPAPEPPSDLKLSTGLWLVLTAIGGSLWLYSLLYNPAPAAYTALLGVVEFAIGYGWVVYLDGQRSARAGLTAALPPIAMARLLKPRTSQGYRPLRFVLSGAILFGLYLLGPAVRPAAQHWAGLDLAPPPPPAAPAEPTPTERLREVAAEKNDQLLLDELRELTDKADVLRTVTPPAAKTELVAELRKFFKSESADVRAAALAAVVGWADDDAKPDVLAALSAPTERERRAALQVCKRWPDPVVVKAVVARLAANEDRYSVDQVLRAFAERDGGKQLIETALLPYLTEAADVGQQDLVRPLSEAFGGERTVKAVQELEAGAKTTDAKNKYRRWWQAVKRSKGNS